MGGVANRGGLPLPVNDSRNAEDKADSCVGNGAGSLRPGSGVWISEGSSEASWAGVGIWRTVGDPVGIEGAGDASRAVERMRTVEFSAPGELLRALGDVEVALGRDVSGGLSAMIGEEEKGEEGVTAAWRLGAGVAFEGEVEASAILVQWQEDSATCSQRSVVR